MRGSRGQFLSEGLLSFSTRFLSFHNPNHNEKVFPCPIEFLISHGSITKQVFFSKKMKDPSKNQEKDQSKEVIDSVRQLQKQVEALKIEYQNQSSKIGYLIKKEENYEIDYKKEIGIPIFVSIIAAIIFWFIFSYIPEKRRRNKLRPKLELDMYEVYLNLFSIFDLVMKSSQYSPSNYQSKIRGGKLVKNDILIGLQSKCINESYLYDENSKMILVVIGEKLYGYVNKIDIAIDRMFGFSNYLSADEILLLEKVRVKLREYGLEDYNKSAITKIWNRELKPVNPSMVYMLNNIYELYELFLQCQEKVFSNKYIDRNVYLNKIQYFYYSGQYGKCKKEINWGVNKYTKDKSLLSFYLFLSVYMNGKKDFAYKKLEQILHEKPHLVSNRSFLKHVLQDEKAIGIIKKHFTEEELECLKRVLADEEKSHNTYVEYVNSLLKYYKVNIS